VCLEHVVDVLAFFPVLHIDQHRADVAGDQALLERPGGGQAGALTGVLLYRVGVVEGHDHALAFEEGEVELVGVACAAQRDHGRAGGQAAALDRQGVDRRLDHIDGVGLAQVQWVAGPGVPFLRPLALGLHPAVELGLGVADVDGNHGAVVERADDERGAWAAVPGLADGDLRAFPGVPAHGLLLDGAAGNLCGDAAAYQVVDGVVRRLQALVGDVLRYRLLLARLCGAGGVGRRGDAVLRREPARRVDRLAELGADVEHQVDTATLCLGAVILPAAAPGQD